ncbi:MAG TPA: hypothetical protein VFC38_06350 [Stellaceae bacterium]|nr:hypothetical protein [Stellaceae bacterium]
MFSTVSSFALLPALLIGGLFFFRSLSNWQSGLHLLIAAMMFGGIIAVVAANGAAAILFRDVFIVAPLYVGFAASRSGQAALGRLPLDLGLALFVVTAYLMISIFNPVDVPALQLAIGLKVWLFYVPFILVGIALAMRPERLFKTFRFFLLLGLVPCAIGLLQSVLVRIFGYETAIGLFFGDAGKAATQGYAYYEEFGGVYRIPSTFSFVGQYVQFLYLYLTIAVIAANADPDSRFRKLGNAAVYIALVAGIFSGTRGALLTYPGLIAVFACFGLVRRQVLWAAPIAMGVALLSANFANLDLTTLFYAGNDLTRYYAKDFIFQQISDALQYGALGNGIGSSTGGARYAIAGGQDIGSMLGFESYFAKIAAELGFIGLAIYAAFLTLIALRALGYALNNRRRATNPIVAPLAVYLLFNLGFSFKGFVLDTDPANIFFWLALGIVVEINRGYVRQSADLHPAAAPAVDYAFLPAPDRLLLRKKSCRATR